MTPMYSPGSSSTPIYSPGASTPQSYSPGSSRNAKCSNCKHLLGKITVLEATVEMYMHPKQHTVNSAALLHEVYNDMGKLDLEIDDGIATPSDRDTRMQLLQEIDKLDNFKDLDLIQKAHIKWDIEGNENSKLFSWADKSKEEISID
ncbi:hypothetical protein Tco_0650603 [Tanacetum coccineum]